MRRFQRNKMTQGAQRNVDINFLYIILPSTSLQRNKGALSQINYFFFFLLKLSPLEVKSSYKVSKKSCKSNGIGNENKCREKQAIMVKTEVIF